MTGPIRKDLVAETSTTTGYASYALSGALTGCQPFSSIGNSNTCHYSARDVDSNGVPTGSWEIGLASYNSSGNTLVRITTLSSSNANAAVNWQAGTRRIELVFPAASIAALEAASGGSGTSVAVSDEGTQLTTAATGINFVGAGVTATASAGSVTVTVPGGSGSPTTVINDLTTGGTTAALSAQQGVTLKGITDGLTTSVASNATAIAAKGAPVAVQDEGTALTSGATTMNFVGAGVTATNSGSSVTVTVPGASAAAIAIQDEGTTLTTTPVSMNFVGSGVTATQSAGAVTVTVPGGSGSVTSLNGIPGESALNLLSPGNIKTLSFPSPFHVAFPAAGSALTLATRPAGESGTIKSIQMTVGAGEGSYDARLRVYWDQAAAPDIDVDLGSLFCSHEGAHTGAAQHQKTKHVAMAVLGTGVLIGATIGSDASSYELKFDMPYGNGFKVEIYLPPTTAPHSGSSIYYLIKYQTETTSPLRLRSQCQSRIDGAAKSAYAATADVPFFDIPNNAGWLVWLSYHVWGAGNYSYLERPTYFYRDGESTTSHYYTGGEEWGATGYYFMSLNRFSDDQVMLTDNNTSSYQVSFGVDLLSYHGGIKFGNELRAIWTNKTTDVATTAHQMAWAFLYYVDTSVSFAPTAPQGVTGATTGATSGNVSWSAPKSQGSSFLTGYTVTLSPGGATQTVAGNVLTASFSGLTTGTAYTPTVVATSSIGSSTGTVGSAFTTGAVANVLTLTPASASVANGSLVTYTVGMASGTFTGTVTPSSTGAGTFSPTSLSAPGTFNFTPSATGTDTISLSNTGGMTNPSNATLTVTTGAYITDSFNRANATTLGTTDTGGQTWSVVSGSGGTPTAGIASNTAYLSGTTDGSEIFAFVNASSAAQTLQVTLSTIGSSQTYSGICIRQVDFSNRIFVQIGSNTGTPAPYALFKQVGGTITTLVTSTVTPTAGDVLTLSIDSSNSVTWKINGTPQGSPVTVSDAALASGTKVGLRTLYLIASGASTVRYDNFSVA